MSVCSSCAAGVGGSGMRPSPVTLESYWSWMERLTNSKPDTAFSFSDGSHARVRSLRNCDETPPNVAFSTHGFAGAQPTGCWSSGDLHGGMRLQRVRLPLA